MVRNDNLRRQEEEIVKEIEDAGFVRVIRYTDEGYDGRRTTVVALYKESDYRNSKKKEDLKPVVSAHSCCSEKDNFNKVLGRLIATGRAYKKLHISSGE